MTELCSAFRWIGQPITACDECGHPAWDHDRDWRQPPQAGPFTECGERPWNPETIDSWLRRGIITPARAKHLKAVVER